MKVLTHYTHDEWKAEAIKRFGTSSANWKFICPSCGFIAAVKDWEEAKAPEGANAYSCIGRYTGSGKEMGDTTGGPCNYTIGGLFNISTVRVEFNGGTHSVFDFAPAEAGNQQ
ncbi:MAG: VVA0879 family protein [Undibacterium umbellatum]|uniref:VVA0879 family protein n=1 Tax=Undibacterium umbellatum TaxID=2762300 RepID=UPI003BB4C1D4